MLNDYIASYYRAGLKPRTFPCLKQDALRCPLTQKVSPGGGSTAWRPHCSTVKLLISKHTAAGLDLPKCTNNDEFQVHFLSGIHERHQACRQTEVIFALASLACVTMVTEANTPHPVSASLRHATP